MNPSNEPDAFIEQIGAYVVGGLDDAQRQAFENHALNCAACTAELDALQTLDREFSAGLGDLAAASDLENRIAERLRRSTRAPRRLLPAVRRGAIAAAATIVIGGFGVMGRAYLKDGRWPTEPFAARTQYTSAAADLRQIGTAALFDSDEKKAALPSLESAARVTEQTGKRPTLQFKDGQVEFRSNPFVGVQRDNLFIRRGGAVALPAAKSKPFSTAYDANDSVLLPVDGPGDAVNTPNQFAQAEELKSSRIKSVTPAVPSSQPAAGPRIIREGTMEFEIDSFDSAFVTIQKVVGEEQGFVAAVDSDKLANGKVRGTVTLRVPPDHLDVLVMKLRSLGELKTQRLGSSDISKAYTDLEGQLRAARAMETRLLELIRTAQGKVKDLLEAENELGVWRTRIETYQGQLNFYDNRISLATLTVVANEKDANTPALATRHEQITAGVEITDVEHGRTEILKSIDAAKGRILESSLQQLEAGQQAAKVVAELPVDATGPILDRLHQLGSVTRLDAQQSEDASGGNNPTLTVGKVKQQPTRLIISLYNIANIAPRITTSLTLASDDVEKTYRAAISNIAKAGGQLIDSKLSRDGAQSVGELRFEIATDQAEAALNDLRSAGQVTQLNAAENPDAANVTRSKQGFVVQLTAADQLPPRQTRSVSVQTSEIAGIQQKLISTAEAAGGKIVSSNLSNADTANANATLTIDIPLNKSDLLLQAAGPSVRTTSLLDDPRTPAGPLARARLTFLLHGEPPLLTDQNGVWSSLRSGLATSARGLLWSLEVLTIGVCLVAPWALVICGGWWLWRRRTSTRNGSYSR